MREVKNVQYFKVNSGFSYKDLTIKELNSDVNNDSTQTLTNFCLTKI